MPGPRVVADASRRSSTAPARLFGARLLADEGHADRAVSEAEEGLHTADICGYGLFSIDLRNTLATLLVDAEPTRALALATEALTRADDPDCDFFWGRLDAHEVLARLAAARGDPDAAREHTRHAESLRARIHLPEQLLAQLR